MSDSSSSSSSSRKKKNQNSSRSPEVKRRSFQPADIRQDSIKRAEPVRSSPHQLQSVIQDQSGLFDQNKKLRRKLKELSIRLDDELQKAAENKLKQNNIKNGHPVSIESQSMELKNAYKMIERLQKTVRDYESKQSYQVTLKRVLDLENIIKKKENELDQSKLEIKTQKKMLKDKQKYIEELLDSTKKMSNPAEDKETIQKLKLKMKKIAEDNELLRKKQLEKHDKLVRAERRVVQFEQQEGNELPIGKEENLVHQIDQWKKKYKESVQRINRQNIYISKLNEKLTKQSHEKSRKSERRSVKNTEKGDKRMVAHSLEDLPSLQKKLNTSSLLEHLPSPKQGAKLRRY